MSEIWLAGGNGQSTFSQYSAGDKKEKLIKRHKKNQVTSQELSHSRAVFNLLSAQYDCDDKFAHICHDKRMLFFYAIDYIIHVGIYGT